MSKRSLGSILIVLITVVYCFYFYFSCIIIPYPMKHDKVIVFTRYIYPFSTEEAGIPAESTDWADRDTVGMEYTIEEADSTQQNHKDVPPKQSPMDVPTQPQRNDHTSDNGSQKGSRVLLSGSRAVKALSSLSFKDKLWLIKLLSRCSMEELIEIKVMLQDGVTYEENLAMYKILRQRVTDQEQKRLDSLIESYTR